MEKIDVTKFVERLGCFFGIIFLLSLFIGIFFMVKRSNEIEIIRKDFLQMEYELTEESCVELHILPDGHTTDGENLYVKGLISNSNYDIYYAVKEDDENIIIRSFPYNERTTKIYKEEGIEPSLVIRQYEKSIENFYDKYTTYEIHVPTGTMDVVSIVD